MEHGSRVAPDSEVRRYNQVLSFVCALGFGAVMCVMAWRVGARLVRVAALMLNNVIIVVARAVDKLRLRQKAKRIRAGAVVIRHRARALRGNSFIG